MVPTPVGVNRVRVWQLIKKGVVPTPVGVNRKSSAFMRFLESGPHARGGEPGAELFLASFGKWSPRPWG